jgi:hypothetical protein
MRSSSGPVSADVCRFVGFGRLYSAASCACERHSKITQQKHFQECRCFHIHLEHDNFAEMMTENLKKSLETGKLANCQILCALNFREKKTEWVTESFKGGKNIQDPFPECLQAWY